MTLINYGMPFTKKEYFMIFSGKGHLFRTDVMRHTLKKRTSNNSD
jgi:hypothetical protein